MESDLFSQWMSDLDYKIVRWDQLPELDLYMDQLVVYVEKHLGSLAIKDEKIITSSMINNYVKAGLIPKPYKKRYNKRHLAYLMAITILKQVMPIQTIKTGIDQVVKKYGAKDAYDLFCNAMEQSLNTILGQIEDKNVPNINEQLTNEDLSLHLASLAFASKIAAIKVIEMKGDSYE